MPSCKSCGAEIKFIKMASGKTMPVDVKELSMVQAEEGSLWDNGKIVKVFQPHWATCPTADEHRK